MQIIKETCRRRNGGKERRGRAQAWGEMRDLISRVFSLGQRLLCPCTFLLTPTCCSPHCSPPTGRKGHLPDVLRPTHVLTSAQKHALMVKGRVCSERNILIKFVHFVISNKESKGK